MLHDTDTYRLVDVGPDYFVIPVDRCLAQGLAFYPALMEDVVQTQNRIHRELAEIRHLVQLQEIEHLQMIHLGTLRQMTVRHHRLDVVSE